ncbi:MAG: B/F/G family RNA polymerase sigma-70 factor [Acidimicrobiales bacterium]|nr:MAG: B/F/G family RNA polymerase sigma-70 factor [Acidimicrobiales bacterium]
MTTVVNQISATALKTLNARPVAAATVEEGVEPGSEAKLIPSAPRHALIEEWLPTAHRLARRFAHRGEPLDDLKQVAAFALIKAANGYNPTYGHDFRSYAIPTIVGELKRYFRDSGWDVRVPRQLQERGMNITKATAELNQDLGRAPSAKELASHLGLEVEEVLEGQTAARAYSATSLQTPAGDSEEESVELGELFGDDDPAFELTDDLISLRPALAELSPREQQAIALRFYGDMTQSQIAARIGTSQMHVSRLLSRSLAQLRNRLMPEAQSYTPSRMCMRRAVAT